MCVCVAGWVEAWAVSVSVCVCGGGVQMCVCVCVWAMKCWYIVCKVSSSA